MTLQYLVQRKDIIVMLLSRARIRSTLGAKQEDKMNKNCILNGFNVYAVFSASQAGKKWSVTKQSKAQKLFDIKKTKTVKSFAAGIKYESCCSKAHV